MFVLVFVFSLLPWLQSSSVADSLAADSLRTDTLREVTVRPNSKLPVEEAIDRSIQQRFGGVKVPSLGEVLEKLLPGINDKITHPFAIKARRREKRRKRSLKSLEDYDKEKTFNELLRDAYRQQMLEDSLTKAGR
ncbi:MAG: hypothetical protein J6W75_13760 [Bacteroidaceae bacterium]|nr:hypothetical protein [Bacteroidaceae bacterium]